VISIGVGDLGTTMEMPDTPVPKHSIGMRAPGKAPQGDSPNQLAAGTAPAGLSQDTAAPRGFGLTAWEPPIQEEESSWDSI
jgi:hypothetical protein